MFYNDDEDRLKALKIEIDQTADWFNRLQFGEITYYASVNDLIDIIVPFVQKKLDYCTSCNDADIQTKINVTKLSSLLNADFYTETQRILSDSAKSKNPLDELQRQLIAYNYPFEFAGEGWFYFIDGTKETRMTLQISLITVIASLGDKYKPFFEEFIETEETIVGKYNTTPRFNIPYYQMVLQLFLQKWLREQIEIYNFKNQVVNTEQIIEDNKKATTKPFSKTENSIETTLPTTLEDLLLDSSTIKTFFEILRQLDFLDDENRFIPKKGIKKCSLRFMP